MAAPPPAAPPEPEWIAWQQASPPWAVDSGQWTENPELAAWSRWREAQLAQEREELAAWARALGNGGPGGGAGGQRGNRPMPLPTAEPWGPIRGQRSVGGGQREQERPEDLLQWLNVGRSTWPAADDWQRFLGQWIRPAPMIRDYANPHALKRNGHRWNGPDKASSSTGHLACIDVNCDLVQNTRTGNVRVANARNPVYKLIQEISRGNTSAASALDRVLAQTSGTGDLREQLPNGVESRIGPILERLRLTRLRELGTEIERRVDPLVGRVSRTHFRGLGASRGDEGFGQDMADDHLYGAFWGEQLPYSRQLGHFLTAVDMGRDGGDGWKRLVVGHEQFGDQGIVPGSAPVKQSLEPTDADLAAFDLAVERDLAGDYVGRDAALASILDPDKHGRLAARRGNSLEDLRLSVRGWALGRLVATGQIKTNRELANWIALHVAGD